MKTQTTLLLLLIAGTAMAQGENTERPRPPKDGFIKQFDKDSDRKIRGQT